LEPSLWKNPRIVEGCLLVNGELEPGQKWARPAGRPMPQKSSNVHELHRKVVDLFESCNFLVKFAPIGLRMKEIWHVQVQLLLRACSPMLVILPSNIQSLGPTPTCTKALHLCQFFCENTICSKIQDICKNGVISRAKWRLSI